MLDVVLKVRRTNKQRKHDKLAHLVQDFHDGEETEESVDLDGKGCGLSKKSLYQTIKM